MSQTQSAELLRIYVAESDRLQGKPLYEAIVAKCRELNIAGATVLRGLEGYGETADLRRSHLVHSDCPILVTVVDAPGNIRRLISALAEMVGTGVMATSPVEMVRVQKSPAA